MSLYVHNLFRSDITNVTNIVSDMRTTLSEDFSFLGVSVRYYVYTVHLNKLYIYNPMHM